MPDLTSTLDAEATVSEDIILTAENVTQIYPGTVALDDGSFNVRKGKVNVLIGENGAGKSTLMKIIGGIYHKDAGHIYLNGGEVEIQNPRQAQHLGISIIHQELNLMPHLTVAQNIYIGREPRGKVNFVVDDKTTNKQADGLFEMLSLDLDPDTKVADLTVAKQQMIEIAKALSFNAKILIMDEPTLGLDVLSNRVILDFIVRERAEGKTIILSTHYLDEAESMCDTIGLLHQGRLVAEGTLGELRDFSGEQRLSSIFLKIVHENQGLPSAAS